MNSLAHRLGLSSAYSFHDVFSITDPDLIAFLPRPCHAILFTFPTTPTAEKFLREEEATLPPYQGHGPEEPILWYHQTIRNACGLIGLLHCTTNLDSVAIQRDSLLESLIKELTPLNPTDRAQALHDSAALEEAHKEAAQRGDSVAPRAEDYDDDHAFIAFVKGKDGTLWELEGRRKGPVRRGTLGSGEDLLSEKALSLGPRAYVKREQDAGTGDIRFSCTALCPSVD